MKDKAEANRAFWERLGKSALETYDFRRIGQPDQTDSHAPDDCLGSALSLLVTGHEDKARQFAALALEVAQEWIRAQRPANLFIEELVKTSPYKEISLARGQADNYYSQHTAEWFMTGEKRIESLRISNKYYTDYFTLLKSELRTSMDNSDVSSLMLRYVEAEQYEETLKLFHNKYKGNKTTPTNLRFSASDAQTCAVLAEYCLGRRDLESFIKGALESRFKRATKWSPYGKWPPPRMHRLRWAYLRARHFGKTRDLPTILAELRGY